MDNFDTPDNIDDVESSELLNEEPDFFEKFSGVFVAPIETFSRMSQHPPRLMDWLLPIISIIVFSTVSYLLMLNSPDIKLEMMEIQREGIEKRINSQVESGSITRAEADERLDVVAEKMEGGMDNLIPLKVLGIILYNFLIFFIVTSIYFLLARFILKGEGKYSTAMTAYGLPQYILLIQIMVVLILSLVFNKLVSGTNLSTLMGYDKDTILGFISSKLDPFRIWFYIVLSISFGKLFKSDGLSKYYISFFGIWIGFGLLMFVMGKIFPFMAWFSI